MVKLSRSPYRAGRRSPEWLKLKLTKQDEFVICGWTDPGGTRMHFGSLILGAQGPAGLQYVGEVGTGFKGSELERLMAMLRRIESPASPFNPPPKLLSAKGRPHWVKPLLVAQIRYTEITDGGRLWPLQDANDDETAGLEAYPAHLQAHLAEAAGQALPERRAAML